MYLHKVRHGWQNAVQIASQVEDLVILQHQLEDYLKKNRKGMANTFKTIRRCGRMGITISR